MYQTLKEVDEDRLHKHIIELLGPNDSIYTSDKLDQAADYISAELEGYGIEVSEQKFEIEGKTYRNIEGMIETGDMPELLLTAHYDTVPQAPGADDNLSGVSVMLEAARILSTIDAPLNVRVIGFTLEEGHPDYFRNTLAFAQELGLMDSKFNFNTYNTLRLRRKFHEFTDHGIKIDREIKESIRLFFDECKNQMNENEILFFNELKDYFRDYKPDSFVGFSGLIGSCHWVEHRSKKIDIAGVLNYDGVGYVSNNPYSQLMPPGFSPDMLNKHLVDDPNIGNYLPIIGDANSGPLLELFTSSCKRDDVNLPHGSLQTPFGYDIIAQKMSDLLRSDHAPFWREGIPALFLTDTGNFRFPYYHTQADTIDKLDFGFMAKVCKASIATSIKSSSPNV